MKTPLRALGSMSLAALLAVGASADTIYMKNGSVIRGKVVGYGSGEFTVLLAGGSRSRATLAGDEIDRIEFEGGAGVSTASAPADAGGGPYDSGPDPYGGGGAPPADDTGGGAVPAASDPYPSSDPGPAPAAQGGLPGGGTEAGEADVTVDPKADWTNTRFRVTRGSRRAGPAGSTLPTVTS
jgi:hypothetical protein